MLPSPVTIAHQPALSFAEGLPSHSLVPFPARLTPFLSHQFKPRAHNPFPLISLHETGGYPPAWSDQSSLPSAVDCRLSAPWFPLTPFPASLIQKQGGTGYWSYHGLCPARPASEGGRYTSEKRAGQAQPLQRRGGHQSPVTNHQSPSSVTLFQPPASNYAHPANIERSLCKQPPSNGSANRNSSPPAHPATQCRSIPTASPLASSGDRG